MKAARWLPASAGLYAFMLVVVVWGSLSKLPVGSDEAAYLLQAKIFATGRVAAPARPIPEFFQQEHVFVDPWMAAKYPPGHAMTLVPGILAGLPGLMPALLVALSAALLCAMTARLTNGATALLAVLLATTSDIALRFNPSYFSEITTTAVFLVCWWALFEYWQSSRRGFLLLAGLASAWAAITRPYTALAFMLPTGLAVLVLVHRRRAWRDLAATTACSLAVLAILPLWNARITGDWRTLTQSEYARRYLPSDRLGFGAATSSPAQSLSVAQKREDAAVRRLHENYTPSAMPAAITERLANIIGGSWSYRGLPVVAILFAALVIPTAVTRIVILTLLCQFGAYLAYAHDPTWTLYYLEFQPALAFLTAAGVFGLSKWMGKTAVRRATVPNASSERTATITFALLALCLAVPTISRAASYRRAHADQRAYREQFEHAVATLPNSPSIVFVRSSSGAEESGLVDNVPNLSAATVWTVHDCGADNARLRALAPDRVPYLYRQRLEMGQTRFTLTPLDVTGDPSLPEARAVC